MHQFNSEGHLEIQARPTVCDWLRDLKAYLEADIDLFQPTADGWINVDAIECAADLMEQHARHLRAFALEQRLRR